MERRRRLWIATGLLTALSLASSWMAGSFLAGMHEATGTELLQVDARIMEWVRVHTPGWAAPLLFFLTEVLAARNAHWLALCIALALGALWARRRHEVVGGAYACALVALGVSAAKLFFQRARPDVPWALAYESTFSFPSGHAASSVVLYGMAAYLLVRLTRRTVALVAFPAALLLALATGYSRIYLGVHYPTDVAAGFTVGAIWLGTAVFVTEALRVLDRPHLKDEVGVLARRAWRRAAPLVIWICRRGEDLYHRRRLR